MESSEASKVFIKKKKSIVSPHFPTGKSALHWAAAVNNVEATLALLKNGANKDMQDSKVSPRFWFTFSPGTASTGSREQIGGGWWGHSPCL